MSKQAAIATDDLTRKFGDKLAVDHVNLHVPQQSVYGFLGPNGAGKSTTIRMLLGLLSPDEGHVHLMGQPFEGHREALLRNVGALVEAPSLYTHLTGRERPGTCKRASRNQWWKMCSRLYRYARPRINAWEPIQWA